MWTETAINRALDYDPASRAAIAELEGQVVCIESTLPPLRFYVLHDPDGLMLLENYEGEPDTTLTGSALSLATLAVVGQEQVSFFATGIEVRGSQELLRKIREILIKLDVDWEAILAKLIGDVPAHLLGSGLRSAANWHRTAFGRAGAAFSGFNQEELRVVPTKPEVETFFRDVGKLKQDVDRASARVMRLIEQQQGENS